MRKFLSYMFVYCTVHWYHVNVWKSKTCYYFFVVTMFNRVFLEPMLSTLFQYNFNFYWNLTCVQSWETTKLYMFISPIKCCIFCFLENHIWKMKIISAAFHIFWSGAGHNFRLSLHKHMIFEERSELCSVPPEVGFLLHRRYWYLRHFVPSFQNIGIYRTKID